MFAVCFITLAEMQLYSLKRLCPPEGCVAEGRQVA